MQKIGEFPGFQHQYRQVFSLVTTLQLEYDVFHSLTLFESLAINMEGQKKVTAWLYNWLLLNVSKNNRVKTKWEHDLGI